LDRSVSTPHPSRLLTHLWKQYEDALSIAAAVVIVATVGFIQEYRSEQSLEALATLVPPYCHVIRNKKLDYLLAENLVPGDIIRLKAGDRIPADCRVLHCLDFSVDESSLTGEQEPKEKTAESLDIPDNALITSKRNIVFMGTLVLTGSCTAVVYATSLETEFGKTFQDMKEVEVRKTPLQVMMDELGKNLSIMSFAIIACIALLGVLQGKKLLNMFNIGVSLAVAAIPEGLPICVTVTLALGVIRMAKRNAICKKLPAVESLGCANFICTDKTGTITQNKMAVVRAFSAAMDDYVMLHSCENGGGGAQSPSSSITTHSSHSTHSSSSTNGRITLWYAGQSVSSPHEVPALVEMMDALCLCNNAHLGEDGKKILGQPTEGALLLAAQGLGLPDRRNQMKRIAENGFSSDRKRMEITCLQTDAHSNGSGHHPQQVTYVKGAVESILPDCTHFLTGSGMTSPLKQHHRERIAQQAHMMANDGLRVLLVASADSHQVLSLLSPMLLPFLFDHFS
jgi:P-type Ca2+ transporter type 2C